MPAHSKLFAAYPVPCLRMTRSVVEKVLSDRKPMGGFHDGGMPEFTEIVLMFGTKTITILRTERHDEEMMAYVSDGNYVVLFFGRKGPTNFAKSEVELGSTGLTASCVEQLFQLLKTIYGVNPEECDNLEESMEKIWNATKPRFTKSGGNSVKGFDEKKWSTIREACMHASILHVCTAEENFQRYKRFVTDVPNPEILALIKSEHFAVMEINDDDIWGGKKGGMGAFMDELESVAGESFDLKAFIAEKCPGQNLLGRILTDFLLAIRDMDYKQYKEEVADVKFFEIIEDTKRQRSA